MGRSMDCKNCHLAYRKLRRYEYIRSKYTEVGRIGEDMVEDSRKRS